MNTECSCFVCEFLCVSSPGPVILNHRFFCKSLQKKGKHYFYSGREKVFQRGTKIGLCGTLISMTGSVKQERVVGSPGNPRSSQNNCALWQTAAVGRQIGSLCPLQPGGSALRGSPALHPPFPYASSPQPSPHTPTSHVFFLLLQVVPKLCLSTFLSVAAVLPCSGRQPKLQHCNSLRMYEWWFRTKRCLLASLQGTNWAKRCCPGVEAALTLYVPGLAGRDLCLAVGCCGCSVGVACPNDSSSNTAPYSDSSSMTDGMHVGREMSSVRTLHGTTRGSKCHVMPFIEVGNVTERFTRCSFLILLSTPPLAWKWQSPANGFLLLTVVTHLITENTL